MRTLSFLILTLVLAHPDLVSGKQRPKRTGADKNGPCGKRFLKQLNGKCYYVGNKKMNWFGAQNSCLRKELNLADVSTPEDFRAVENYLRGFVGLEDFWFGGNDLQTEGRFQYISNGKVVRYLGAHGLVEPTFRSNVEDCLEIRIRSNNTVVLDMNCLEKRYFICETPAQKCARPVEDEGDEVKTHSHEHLHHFHHDAAKKEKQVAAKADAEVESDSRPLDNSNSTEIGVSEEEAVVGSPSEPTTEGDDDIDSGSEESTTPGSNSTGTTGAEGAADAAGTTTPTPGEGAAPAPAGDAAKPAGDAAKPAGDAAKPAGDAAKPAGDAAAAPAAGGAAAAPAAGEPPAAPAAPAAGEPPAQPPA